MKKDTVVFLNIYPLGKIFSDAIAMDQYRQAGFNLIYLDMSKIYFPGTCERYGARGREYVVERDYFIKCEKRQDVETWIRDYTHRAWFFVLQRGLFINPNEGTWLYRIFKKYRCDYIIQNLAPFPNHGIGSLKDKKELTVYALVAFLRMLVHLRFKEVLRPTIRWLQFFLMSRNVIFRAPSYSFMAGDINNRLSRNLYTDSRTVSIPSIDFGNYSRFRRELAENGRKPEFNNYIVYIDPGWVGSPDEELLGYKTIDERRYFEMMNLFFDKLESMTGKRVLIASAGKYLYAGSEFNGRTILYNRTCELVYYADMVLAHASTAIGYAAVMHKPLLILTIEKLCSAISKQNIKDCALALNKKVIDVENDLRIELLGEYSRVDNEVYYKYIRDYMASKPFQESCAEVIISTLISSSKHLSS